MTSSIAVAVAGARVTERATSRATKPIQTQTRPHRARRVALPRSVVAHAVADEDDVVAASAEELEAALAAEAGAASAAAADGAQSRSSVAMANFAEAKARASSGLVFESEAAARARLSEAAIGDENKTNGNAPPTTKQLTGAERRAIAARNAVQGLAFTGDTSNNVSPVVPAEASASKEIPAGADEVVELTNTVRELKTRMSSLAKLLEEAVARRQNLETDLSVERESSAGYEKAGAVAAKALESSTAEVVVLKTQLEETCAVLAVEQGKLVDVEEEMKELRVETTNSLAAVETAMTEASKRRKEATAARFELNATKEMLAQTQAAKVTSEKSLIAIAATTEMQMQQRLKAGVDEAAAASAANIRRIADDASRKAAALLASAAALEATARDALGADVTEASAAALVKATKEINAAVEARDLAVAAAAATQRRLTNQTELLRRVDQMTEETTKYSVEVTTQAEQIAALTNECALLRESAADAAAAAARGLSMADAAENKIADRVSQTLQAAETCVSTAEKVKQEVERNSVAAEGVAAQQLEAATARANAAEENLRRSNVRLDEMTAIAGKKEAMDMKNDAQARELVQKSRLIKELVDETAIAKDTISHWENKATSALVELEQKNRQACEANENATSLKVQIASAMARAAHAEESLRSQTELLDEMAEIAALKESANALVVTLQQELEAKEGEVLLLSEAARGASEAAAMWRAKATAAADKVESRALAAETAAELVKSAAEEKLRILEDNEGAYYASAEEHAVEQAVRQRIEQFQAEAEQKINAANASAESLKRALAASNQGSELWREKAEQAAAELETLIASDDLESRISDMKGKGGRLVAHAFSKGEDLRQFIVKGSPRLDDVMDGENARAFVELESVGLGKPFHGRYDLIDARDPRQKLTAAEAASLAKAASEKTPVPRWDPTYEHANREKLPFNPRAFGLVGRKSGGQEPREKKGPASPR